MSRSDQPAAAAAGAALLAAGAALLAAGAALLLGCGWLVLASPAGAEIYSDLCLDGSSDRSIQPALRRRVGSHSLLSTAWGQSACALSGKVVLAAWLAPLLPSMSNPFAMLGGSSDEEADVEPVRRAAENRSRMNDCLHTHLHIRYLV